MKGVRKNDVIKSGARFRVRTQAYVPFTNEVWLRQELLLKKYMVIHHSPNAKYSDQLLLLLVSISVSRQNLRGVIDFDDKIMLISTMRFPSLFVKIFLAHISPSLKLT